jgi:hypothetical protein
MAVMTSAQDARACPVSAVVFLRRRPERALDESPITLSRILCSLPGRAMPCVAIIRDQVSGRPQHKTARTLFFTSIPWMMKKFAALIEDHLELLGKRLFELKRVWQWAAARAKH